MDNRVAPPGRIVSSGILSQGFVRCGGLHTGLFSRLPPGGGVALGLKPVFLRLSGSR